MYSSGYPNFKKELGARQAQKWVATMTEKWQACHFKGVYKSLVCLIESKGKTERADLFSKCMSGENTREGEDLKSGGTRTKR